MVNEKVRLLHLLQCQGGFFCLRKFHNERKCAYREGSEMFYIVTRVKLEPVVLTTSLPSSFSTLFTYSILLRDYFILFIYLFIYLMTWWCNSNVLDRCSWCWQGKLELIDWWWLIVFRVICGDGHYLSPGSGVEVNLVTWPVILEIPSACQSHVILQVFGQSPVPCEIHLSPDLVVLLAGYQTSLNQWKNWKKSILWGITITSRTIQIFFYTSSFFFFFSSVNFHSVWAHPHCIYTSLQK